MFLRGVFTAVSSRLLLLPPSGPLFSVASRGYLRSFWAEKTAFPFPGHLHQHQKHFQHIHKLKLQIAHARPTEIKRLRVYGYEAKMKYVTGRRQIMKKMLSRELFLGEA